MPGDEGAIPIDFIHVLDVRNEQDKIRRSARGWRQFKRRRYQA